MTPIAPFSAITKDMMKNANATIPSDSRQVRPGGRQHIDGVVCLVAIVPIAMILEANCHVAALESYQCLFMSLS